ncbi:MAG: hypothetical protein GEV11_26900 [Streptosporangiales bacterium]|nr:hypothetical protein [Streptosporangiales bacterium]
MTRERPHADAVRLAQAIAEALTVPQPGPDAEPEEWDRRTEAEAGRAHYVDHVLGSFKRDGLDLTLRLLARAPVVAPTSRRG